MNNETCNICGEVHEGTACHSTDSGARCAGATGSVAERLTPEQIQNWRHTLSGILGPYALVMLDEDVQKIRDQMQAKIGGPQNSQAQERPATDNE